MRMQLLLSSCCGGCRCQSCYNGIAVCTGLPPVRSPMPRSGRAQGHAAANACGELRFYSFSSSVSPTRRAQGRAAANAWRCGGGGGGNSGGHARAGVRPLAEGLEAGRLPRLRALSLRNNGLGEEGSRWPAPAHARAAQARMGTRIWTRIGLEYELGYTGLGY